MRILLRVLFILFAGALSITLIVGAASVLLDRGGTIVTEEPLPPTAGETAATEPPSYQVIGPTVVTRAGMLFEATGHLVCNDFTFNINGTFPDGFSDQFPNNEIPPIFVSDKHVVTLDGQPLQLEPFGGGGGGGEIGDFDYLGQGVSLHVVQPLVEGQTVQITSTVTFNDYVGIPDPVTFEFYLLVENCPLPTAMPYYASADNAITNSDNVTIAVTPILTQSALMIDVDASGRMSLLGPDPATSTVSAFDDLRVEFPDQTLAFDLEPFAGGGSGPGEGEIFLLNRERGFRVLSPIQVGQVIPITIWLTLAPFYGIPDPVPFYFELTVLP